MKSEESGGSVVVLSYGRLEGGVFGACWEAGTEFGDVGEVVVA